MKRFVVCVVMLVGAAAFAQKPPQAPVPPVPMVPMVPMVPPVPALPHLAGGGFMSPAGIPPALAQKLGISSEVQKKVRDMSFDANEQLIPLESDLKRAQLDLERTLAATQVEESSVMNKLDVVGRAELAVRKNRMGLLVRIRKALGPDAWERLQGEMTGPGGAFFMMNGGPGNIRREVRIIRDGNGGETVNVEGD